MNTREEKYMYSEIAIVIAELFKRMDLIVINSLKSAL